MSPLEETLSRLEARLKALVEGSAARLFPVDHMRQDLVAHLVGALQDGLQNGPDGELVAPNLFTILLPPEQAQAWGEDHELLAELARNLEQAGEEAGARFPSAPMVKIHPSSEAGSGKVNIWAQVVMGEPGTTRSMEIPRESAGPTIPAEAFLIVNGERIFPLERGLVTLGRHPDNDLTIDDARVSRNHAQVRALHGAYTIFDLGSTGGTFVNGVRITQCPLSPGDVISLAGVPLVYGQETAQPGGETQELALFPPQPPDGERP